MRGKARDCTCGHNIGVLCEETGRNCDKCGWNPRVSKRRASKFHEMLQRKREGWMWQWRKLNG